MSRDTMIDTNNIIPEESCVAVIDGGSTNENAPKNLTKNPKEREYRQTTADYFRFVEMVEETKMLEKYKADHKKPSFVKDFNGDKKDWTENHFFYNDAEEKDECKVFFTSYQVKTVIENSARADFYSKEIPIKVNKTHLSSGFYYILAQKPHNVIPVPSITENGAVHESLEYMKSQDPDFFEGCTLENVLERLSEEDLNNDPELAVFAKTYRKALVDRDLKTMFKPLYDWQAGNLDRSLYELRLGLGHVRKIYKKKNGEQRILNAPLIEVPVEVDEESLKVVPIQDGRLKWNGEAKDVLLYTGGKRRNVLADFQTLIADGDPMKVVLGDPTTFLKFVQKASDFSWDNMVKDATDDSLHTFRENSEASVLTTEWCIFVRRKRSNSTSSDAHAFAKAIEETKLNLSSPLRSLVLGFDGTEHNCTGSVTNSSSFVMPLPASKCQLEVIENVFSKDQHVSIIQGPPGTGKTQTGVNIVSIALQKGSNCLVTSDNPQALEAFEQKLPPKLSKFCINISTMQEDGIGKLSMRLDRMEADQSALFEDKKRYKREKEMLEKKMCDLKSKHRQCLTKLEKDYQSTRFFLQKTNFHKLVQHGLKREAKICPYVASMLKHEKLDALKTDLVNLLDAQGVEEEEQKVILFDCDESEKITETLIKFVEKKAEQKALDFRNDASKPLLGPPKPLRGMVSSFKLGERGKPPSSREDWARILRALSLKKMMSDFREVHVESLKEKGCPETFIYTNDSARRQNLSEDFIKTVRDVHESVKDADRREIEDLLGVLEDVRNNRRLQEDVRALTAQIRKLKEDLSHVAIAQNQSTLITGRDLGNFSQLKELASRMKDSEIDATKASDATLRRKAKFADKFRKSLRCMPLLLMTTEQVSRYIPVDHRFGMVIADEASQSPSSTALTLLGRAEQAVIIGDSRQTLPKDDLNEESKSALEKCKGELRLADSFVPGDGGSLFDICLGEFAVSNKTLCDHFRCPPDGVEWSNNQVYSDQLRTYKPSGTIATKCLKVTKDCKKDMAHFVYNEVEKSLSSGIENAHVLTIGVIVMGQKKEEKSFKEILEEKLAHLEDEYGTEAIGRHCIKVASPEKFQSQEKDIILIGCLSDNAKVPDDKGHERKRLWNVATTRHKRLSVIFSPFDTKKIKKDDHKKEIFFQYRRSSKCVGGFKKGNHDVRSMAEDLLFDQLVSCNYEVARNKATIWNGCLSIGLKNGSISDKNALIMIENYGENHDDWLKVVDEQADLEETGTSCLRVNALALSLCFHAVFDDVEAFLKEKAGLTPAIKKVSENCNSQSHSSKQKKRLASKSSTSAAKRGKKSL